MSQGLLIPEDLRLSSHSGFRVVAQLDYSSYVYSSFRMFALKGNLLRSLGVKTASIESGQSEEPCMERAR